MIKELVILPYFTLSQAALFLKDKKTASIYISNWIKKEYIKTIKGGIYISSKKLLEISLSGKINIFKEFIGTNLIYSPSYLSLEYVLFEYNIITENVYNLTLITTKKTTTFKNTFGKFVYKSIKLKFFGDYEIIKKDDFIIYKATPEKALFDWFYFKRGIIWDDSYFKELRLNKENINLKKFEKLIKKYKSKKLERVLIFLKKLKG